MVFGKSVMPRLSLRKVGGSITMYHRRMDRSVQAAAKRSLIRQAAYCKGAARRMLRKGKEGEGRSTVPRLWSGNFFKMSIQWGYDSAGKFSMVGPIQTSRRNVPRSIEHGGTSIWVRNHYGQALKGRQRVKAKPFMKLAQKITLNKFPAQFRGSFRP